mgnify:CR=1 FL=1
MRAILGLIFFFSCHLLLSASLQREADSALQIEADTASRKEVRVREIFVIGNKKTKKEIILRELSVEKGRKYNRLVLEEQLKKDKNLIYNTNLFDEVDIQILAQGDDEVSLVIKVTERWYIYPAPIFRLADRNVMDWLLNRQGKLNRFNYGLKLDHYNFRGRAERIRFVGQLGFERRLILRYSIPYIEKTQKHGLSFRVIYDERENLAYTTQDHLQLFLEDDEINRRSFSSEVTYSYRPSYYSFHYLTLGYLTGNISDTLASINPNFFGDSQNDIKNFRLDYSFVYDKRNNRNYPTTGHYLQASASKIGLGIYDDIDITSFEVNYNKYTDLGNNFYLANGLVGYTSFPQRQPYFYYYGLGYFDIFARGFELDVIEGSQWLLSRNSFRKLLWSTEANISRFMPLDQFSRIPFTFYAKFFFDAGWVNNYPQYEFNTRLTNTAIYSAGLGIDFVTVYDLVLRFEYSYNSTDEFNFALNVKADL